MAVQIVTQRLMQLQMKGTPSHMPAWVHIKRRQQNAHGQTYWEVVKAKGHMDEVQALAKAVGARPGHEAAACLKQLRFLGRLSSSAARPPVPQLPQALRLPAPPGTPTNPGDGFKSIAAAGPQIPRTPPPS